MSLEEVDTGLAGRSLGEQERETGRAAGGVEVGEVAATDVSVPRSDEMPSPVRLEAFSDAVFAIIITLLVLDLRVPRQETLHGVSLGAVLLRQWPVYVAFILSFLQVGVVWANHHAMFHYIRHTDHLLLVYNLLLLLCVAFLPFTTALLSEYVRAGEPARRLAALSYSGALGVAGIFFSAAWQHALHAGLVSPHADPHRLHALARHWLLMPLFYGVAFLLALVNVSVSLPMYLVLLLYYALPGPAVVRLMTRRARGRALVASEGAGPGAGAYHRPA